MKLIYKNMSKSKIYLLSRIIRLENYQLIVI